MRDALDGAPGLVEGDFPPTSLGLSHPFWLFSSTQDGGLDMAADPTHTGFGFPLGTGWKITTSWHCLPSWCQEVLRPDSRQEQGRPRAMQMLCWA